MKSSARLLVVLYVTASASACGNSQGDAQGGSGASGASGSSGANSSGASASGGAGQGPSSGTGSVKLTLRAK